MTKDELKALGIIQKKTKSGTRYLLKDKDLSGNERYATLKITDKSSRKEITAEIEKARIKLKNCMEKKEIARLVKAFHTCMGHRPSTVRGYAVALRGITLNPASDREWVVEIACSGAAPGTKREKFSVIRAFFRWLASTGVQCTDPTAGVKFPPHSTPRSRVMTDDEISRLTASCAHDRDASLMLALILHTGCRVSTAMRVKPGDLDGGALTLYNVKRGRPYAHAIPVHDAALIALIERGYEGSPRKAYTRLKDHMYRIFAPDAHGERLSPHSLRHTWATRALQAGVPLDVISRMLDHSSISTTLSVYARHSPEQLADAARAVDATLPQKG